MKSRGISIIFTSEAINDYCFWLLIRLIFGLIDSISCGGIGELNLNLRKIYTFNIGYIFLYLCRWFLSQIKSCSLIMQLTKH